MPRLLRQFLFAAGLLGFLTGAGGVERPSAWWNGLAVHDLTGAPLPAGGRWIVLVFLSPECPVANTSVPVLNALAAEFGPAGFSFVGVYADPTLDLTVLRRHAADYRLGFATADDRAQHLRRSIGATYTPETFVFSRDGALLYHGRIDDRVEDFGPARPAATHQDLREVLMALAAGRPGPFESRPGFGCTIPEPARP